MVWDFRAVRNNAGKMDLMPLSPEQSARKSRYYEALYTAQRTRVPNPFYSGHYVNAAVLNISNEVSYAASEGGNIEYGFCKAIHGEVSAANNLRGSIGRQEGLPILAFYSSFLEPTCCGDCRDFLFDEVKEAEIVSGPKDGVVSVATLEDLKFENFREVIPDYQLSAYSGKTFDLGSKVAMDAFSGGKFSERSYVVGVVTEVGNFYVGAHDVGTSFHPIYAGRDAVRQARRAKDPFVSAVFVVGQSKPHLLYDDRQALLELNADAEILRGKTYNPKIYLTSRQGGAWEAGLKEILPFPFVVSEFGTDFRKKYGEWVQKAYDKSKTSISS